MADQSDKWTQWIDFLAAGFDRNIIHIGGKVFRPDFQDNLAGVDVQLVAARTAGMGGDYATAVIHLVNAGSRLNWATMNLMYAAYDIRELLESVAMSKEQIFDLWLERAGEMEL